MKNKTDTNSSSYLIRYALPIFIIVIVFLVFGFILFRQRKLELKSLELRLQMQSSLLSEKISSSLHTYEMAISLLELLSQRVDVLNVEERDIFEKEMRKQLILEDGLIGINLYTTDGNLLYSSTYRGLGEKEINTIIIHEHIEQEKEFAISSLHNENGLHILMSRVLHKEDSSPSSIIALTIDTDEFFDPLIISTLKGIVSALLYDHNGTILALWQEGDEVPTPIRTKNGNISDLSPFSLIDQLEDTTSCIKGGVRILSLQDTYIPLAQVSNFPFTIALHADIPTAMNAYDKTTYINLIAICVLLIILLYINHRLHHHRSLKERLQQNMVRELRLLVKSRTRELEKLSSEDFLTGLMNRRQFNLLLDKEIIDAKKDATPFSIIAIDIDSFKSINDTYGHIIGDKVLIHICQQLTQGIQEDGYISRWGGDELMILLPNTKQRDAYNIGVKLCNHIENRRYNDEIYCTISLGVAQYKESESLITLIRRADEALYKAKELGRNRVISAK